MLIVHRDYRWFLFYSKISIYSLYNRGRKPQQMLFKGIEILNPFDIYPAYQFLISVQPSMYTPKLRSTFLVSWKTSVSVILSSLDSSSLLVLNSVIRINIYYLIENVEKNFNRRKYSHMFRNLDGSCSCFFSVFNNL